MGFCLEGKGRISVEVRRESFYVHADYGYTKGGEHTPDSDHHGRHWREAGPPEFHLDDLADLIAALEEARAYCEEHGTPHSQGAESSYRRSTANAQKNRREMAARP